MNVAGSGSCPILGNLEPPDIETGELDCISLLLRRLLSYTPTLYLSLKRTI